MADTFFFNGTSYTSPTTVSQVNDTAMAPVGATTGNVLAIVGNSTGGQPGVVYTLDNPNEAAGVFFGGDLVIAARKAFNPSDMTPVPNKVVMLSVTPNTSATATLQDSSATASVLLTAAPSGTKGNSIAVQVLASTLGAGLEAIVSLGSQYFTAPQIYQPAVTITWNGTGSAAVVVTGTTLTLGVTGTTLATIDLTALNTATDLAAIINGVANFSAVVAPGASQVLVNGKLDQGVFPVTAGGSVTVTATLQALVAWFNSPASGGLVTAVAAPGAKTFPAAMTAPVNLAGGTSAAAQVANWSAAFTVLQSQDVQHVCVLSSDPAVHALLAAHVAYMSGPGKKERRGYAGPPLGTTIAQAGTLAGAIGSDRVSYAFPGSWDYDTNGNLTLYPPYFTAVHVAAGFAGLPPGQTMTNHTITVQGLELILRNPGDTDGLIQSGVCCVEATKSGFKVVRAVSTWRANNNFDKVETSCGVATDYMSRTVRSALDQYRGSAGGASPQTLSQALNTVVSTLTALAVPAPAGPGILVGDSKSPPFLPPTGKIVGDTLTIEYQASPVVPLNFIGITEDIVPYSGTATAAAASS